MICRRESSEETCNEETCKACPAIAESVRGIGDVENNLRIATR